jgi:hypothetical protein
MAHAHNDTVLLQYRPAIKCIDPIHGNPISCDEDDISPDMLAPLPQDENGFTPIRIVKGGPSWSGMPEDDEE